jgi:hypothetical protein
LSFGDWVRWVVLGGSSDVGVGVGVNEGAFFMSVGRFREGFVQVRIHKLFLLKVLGINIQLLSQVVSTDLD